MSETDGQKFFQQKNGSFNCKYAWFCFQECARCVHARALNTFKPDFSHIFAWVVYYDISFCSWLPFVIITFIKEVCRKVELPHFHNYRH